MPEKKTVVGLTLDTGSTRQDLNGVQESLAETGDTGVKMAANVTRALQAIETGADRTAKRIATEFKKVPETALEPMLAAFAALQREVQQLESTGAQVPEPLRRALQVAEAQIRTTDAAIKTINADVAAGKAQFEAEAKAIDATADALAALAAEEAAAEQKSIDLAVSVDATQEALNALAAEAERSSELVVAVAEKFAEIPARIEEIKSSNEVFDVQHDKIEALLDPLKREEAALKKLGTVGEAALKDVRLEMDRVEGELRQLDAQSTTSAGKVRDAMVRVEQASKNATSALKEGSNEAGEKITRMAGLVYNLRQAIAESQQQGAPIDDTSIAKLKAAEAQLEQLKTKFKGMKQSVAADMGDMQTSAGSLGDMIERELGTKFGATATKTFAALAALKGGWDLGTVAAQKMGINVDYLSEELNKVMKSIGGVVMSFGDMTAALLSGDWQELKNNAREADFQIRAMASGFIVTQDALRGYSLLLRAGFKDIDDYEKHHAALEEVQRAYVKALGSGREAQDLWHQAMKVSQGDLSTLATLLPVLSKAFDDLHIKLEAQKIATNDIHDAIMRQIDAEKSAIATKHDEIRVIDDLVAKFDTEIQRREHLNAALKSAIEIIANLEPAVKGTLPSIESLAKAIAQLDWTSQANAIGPLIDKVAELAKGTTNLSDATKRYVEQLSTSKAHIEQLAQQNQQLRQELESTAKSIDAYTHEEIKAREEKEKQIRTNEALIHTEEGRIKVASENLAATKESTKATQENADATKAAGIIKAEWTNSTKEHTKSAKEAADVIRGQTTATNENSESTKKASDATRKLKDDTAAAGNEIGGITVKSEGGVRTIKNVGDEAEDAGDKMVGFNGKMGTFSDSIGKVTDPTEKLKKILVELNEGFKKTDGIADHTEKVIALTRAYEGAAGAAGALVKAHEAVENAGKAKGAVKAPETVTPPPAPPKPPAGAGGKLQ